MILEDYTINIKHNKIMIIEL